MDRVSHGFVQAGGLRLHYLDFGGDGRPIVCLHGVTGHAWVWRDVARILTSAGRVVSVDMRGFGDSQWSPEQRYMTEDHVGDLAHIIEDLGVEQVDIAGSSWGGLVGIAFATTYPDRVRKLALVDVAPSSNQGQDQVPARPGFFDDHAQAVTYERSANPYAPDDMVETAAAFGTRPGEHGRLYLKQDPYFLSTWPFRADDRWDQLSALTSPILVVHAANSFIPKEVAERMVGAAKDATLVDISGSGHVIPVENPEALGRTLNTFFAD